MRNDRAQSEEFVTKEGLGQGGALSPILFIIIMDDVKKKSSQKSSGPI